MSIYDQAARRTDLFAAMPNTVSVPSKRFLPRLVAVVAGTKPHLRVVEQDQPTACDDSNDARLVALLSDELEVPVTIGEMLDGGVRAPALTVYELQVAGYPIDRVRCEARDGRSTVGYRLRGGPDGHRSGRAASELGVTTRTN
jgi:hypothetical protein